MKKDLLDSFVFYLDKLEKEIEKYPDGSSLWRTAEGIANSGGNLCRHLTGCLHHFIGHGLGDTGYVRDRPLEFSIKGLPKAQLFQDIKETKNMLAEVLPSVNMEADFPPELWGGKEMTVRQSVIKLLTHLAYHTGQINYHRRLVATRSAEPQFGT